MQPAAQTGHPLRCKCGALQGMVHQPQRVRRMVCYCKDCQAFARFLGKPDEVLDAQGGTEVLATLSQEIHFTQGVEHLACMSLSPKGLLRWYARCCNTPIANTVRDCKLSYVGLVHSCLGDSPEDLHKAFGPVRMLANTKGAKTPVASSAMDTLTTLVPIFASVGWARLNGGYKTTPFFDAQTNTPVVQPLVLGAAERKRLTDVV